MVNVKRGIKVWLCYHALPVLAVVPLVGILCWLLYFGMTKLTLPGSEWILNAFVPVTLVVLGLVGAILGVKLAHTALTASAIARYGVPAGLWIYSLVLTGGLLILGDGSVVNVAEHDVALAVYEITHGSYILLMIMGLLMGQTTAVVLGPLIYRTAFLTAFTIVERRRVDAVRLSWKLIVTPVAALICFGVGIGEWAAYQQHVLPPDYGYEYGGGYSSVSLYDYDLANPENRLPQIESSYVIEKASDFPIMDGAEAAYPVYSAFAKACYQDIESMRQDGEGDKAASSYLEYYVTFTNTIYAFERLIDGSVDIFFGAQPSAEQQRLAEEAGVELVLTPIGKEAFVFFVSENNPVEGLTVKDIQGIYSGTIRNWQDVGGQSERIFAFQRPENSGSQTLLQHIMGDIPIMEPLKEEYVGGMGGIIQQVADYRNYEGALGYTFRFFLTNMQRETAGQVRMLTIDGVAPTQENILSETYPFTTCLYAITVKGNDRVPQAYLDWMQGDEGQQIIERIGYVPLG